MGEHEVLVTSYHHRNVAAGIYRLRGGIDAERIPVQPANRRSRAEARARLRRA